MTNYLRSADRPDRLGWDEPLEFPKPNEQPELPVKQEPVTPQQMPEQPEVYPEERPGIETPPELPQRNG